MQKIRNEQRKEIELEFGGLKGESTLKHLLVEVKYN